MAIKLSDDVLVVRTYPERVLVELREERGDEFIVIDQNGCVFHIGMERIALEWNALKQFVEIVGVAETTFRPKKPRSR